MWAWSGAKEEGTAQADKKGPVNLEQRANQTVRQTQQQRALWLGLSPSVLRVLALLLPLHGECLGVQLQYLCDRDTRMCVNQGSSAKGCVS